MSHPWFRHLMLLAAFAVVMGIVRPAFAYAPFCDPRAATSVALPPFTAIPDLRWEPAFDLLLLQWCDQLQAARTDRNPEPARDRLSDNQTRSWPDLASLRPSLFIPRRHAAIRIPHQVARITGPPGIHARVYRPPR